ncbi:MAG: uracil phosphoribosyltransferase [Crocinitomicaceae bacterium]|nr:uracil phosphoribosyltransferase [Crocinitomicaceae bacterium]
MIYNFSTSKSIVGPILAELRDVQIQKDGMRFRKNLERLGEILAYEVSKKLDFKEETVTTPLGEATLYQLNEQPILATILRAGLPMHQGFLNFFDKADSAFVSAYRKHIDKDDFEIQVEYVAAPTFENKTLIIIDPMLATGSSMVSVYKTLIKQGNPTRVIIASAIASPEALEYLQKHLPESTQYFIGAIDLELTAQAYIVPGMGDAGDLAFGVKC